MTIERDLVTEELARIPLFADLSPELLERVGTLVTEFDVPAGHVLIQAGEPGSGMFVLREGRVSVETESHTFELGPGEFVGELSLLADGLVRTARVRATTPVRGLALSRRDFAELLHEDPHVAVAMLPVLARRLAQAV